MKRIHLIIAAVFVCLLAVTAIAHATSQEAATDTATAQEAVHGDDAATEAAHGDAVAAEAEHGEVHGEAAGHGESHALPWGNYIGRVINLIIVIGIIWYAAGKKIKVFFGGRRKQIKQDLEDLEARKNEAAKKLKDVEQSIANLSQEKQSILDEAKKQGDALKEAIIEKAKKDAIQLTEQAKRSAEFEAKAAVDDLRAQMADLVVEAAIKLVQDKLSDKDHEKLVDEYLTKVVLN